MAYCGTIGNVNVLEFVSTDLFDESQENPFLLQQQQLQPQKQNASVRPGCGPRSSPNAKLQASPLRKHAASVRFVELPLDDHSEQTRPALSPQGYSPNAKRQSAVILPTPGGYQHTAPVLPQQQSYQPYQPYQPCHSPTVSSSGSAFSPPASPPATRPSITITVPFGMGFSASNSATSTATTVAEETELHKLLYSLSQLGLDQHQPPPQPALSPMSSPYQQPPMQQQQHYHNSCASTASAPTSPTSVRSNSLWLPSASASAPSPPEPRLSTSSQPQPTGTASLMFRALPSRQSRRLTTRQSNAARRFSSAPNSPLHDASSDGFFPSDDNTEGQGYEPGYGGGSQPSSPQRSRGSVTFLTVKNLLRGGGALARTVRREQPHRRPTSMGSELTISSRLKRREKFQRPTVITDANHRVSTMKLGTSPMKVKLKHKAFPESWKPSGVEDHEADHHEADWGMPSPRRQLHRESLITLETLDKIGTRHACPVQLIEEPLPDFSNIQPRVDAWNHYQKPKKNLRRPSAWLLGATATLSPQDLHY